MADEPPLRLVAASDADFAALEHDGDVRIGAGLRQPPGGVDAPAIIAVVRRLAADLERTGVRGGHWMMVVGDEIVGLCGFKPPLSDAGEIEIGYGVAASRRRRGYATAGVAAVIARAPETGVRALIAYTMIDNVGSELVLLANGFNRAGSNVDATEGALHRWRRPL
jgi:RimJ/RimL family protein N-acetyltransferase